MLIPFILAVTRLHCDGLFFIDSLCYSACQLLSSDNFSPWHVCQFVFR